MPLAGGQEIFAEGALETGKGISQSSTLLIGVKSDYPAITIQKRKFTPFSIIGYGALIKSVLKEKAPIPAALGLNAATVESLGTGAAFAEQYAGGLQTSVGSWNLGIGVTADKTASGWKGYPFIFLSREFATK
jgi:hypothetical protein